MKHYSAAWCIQSPLGGPFLIRYLAPLIQIKDGAHNPVILTSATHNRLCGDDNCQSSTRSPGTLTGWPFVSDINRH
jgi:hypothetical protein